MRPILLAGTTDAFARTFYNALGDELRERVKVWPHPPAETGALEIALSVNPVVLVLGPSLVDKVAFGLARQVDAERSDVSVIVVQRSGEAHIEDALAAGVRGMLTQTSDPEAIRSTVVRALEAAERFGSAPEPTAPIAPQAAVTTIVSPKGGVGKTVLATNLAVGLASVAPRGVVILDLDLQFGDVAYALGLRPRHTMFDAVPSNGQLDITTLKVYLTHHKSDLYALCAPDDPARGEMITVSDVERIVTLLSAEFDHVVVDTGAGLSEPTLATLEMATDVVFVPDMDVPSVRHLAKVITAFDQIGLSEFRSHVVLNRADAKVGLSMSSVATQAGLDIDIRIPLSKQVPISLNEGTPVILSHPRSPVTRRIWELVERISGKRIPDQHGPVKRSA